ncbi:DUF488 family protein [Rossellomorea marisflavi]|uniref:DUF488 domain-containing protein n=1 Tax=Rossellomorea marisflavi TaxID=189381 RepID=UPI00064F8E5C|nr:DUF488 domain-containing protein [Rossellomorea marisflavi]KMK90760.1 hypothetical protein VL03_21395 [Rossellomorea marisflavi]
MKVTTIGFSKKSLEQFVNLLKEAEVDCLIDTRLNNTSQLSGFAKKNDLKFILENFLNINYLHDKELAPSSEILTDYKKKLMSWEDYKVSYTNLLLQRKVQNRVDELLSLGKTICFLCSEHQPEQCHRSVLVDFIKQYNKQIVVQHLC